MKKLLNKLIGAVTPESDKQKAIRAIAEALANSKLDRFVFAGTLRNEDGSGTMLLAGHAGESDTAHFVHKISRTFP